MEIDIRRRDDGRYAYTVTAGGRVVLCGTAATPEEARAQIKAALLGGAWPAPGWGVGSAEA